MKIAVYAIALNEAVEAAGWAEATAEADYQVVLDTGSTDGTGQCLIEQGVVVHHAVIRPWRFDDALNTALALLPADVDACFRIDMDERPRPGWRDALERAWKPDTALLRHVFFSSPEKSYYGDRIHCRFGFRWSGPYHETLIWRHGGDYPTATAEDLTLDHMPRAKPRPLQIPLLREGVLENKSDPLRAFLLADALLGEGHLEEGTAEVYRYISLSSPTGEKVAYLWRKVAAVDEMAALQYLGSAQAAHPSASNHLAYAEQYFRSEHWGYCYSSCQYALSMLRSNPQRVLGWTDDERLRGPLLHDLAATAAWNLWDFEAAYGHAVEAVRRAPNDVALRNHLIQCRLKVETGGTLDPDMVNTHQPAPAEARHTVLKMKLYRANDLSENPPETVVMGLPVGLPETPAIETETRMEAEVSS